MKKIQKIVICGCMLSLLFCLPGYSQDVSAADAAVSVSPVKIDMSKAVNDALETMEDIKIGKAEEQKAYHAYREAQAARYPDLNGRFSWVNNARYPVNARYPGGRISDYEMAVGATLSQVICSFGRISSAVEAADKGVEMGKLNVEVKQADVILNAKISYYTVIFAQKALEIVMESYQHTLENKEILEKRSAMGRVSRKDNIKVEADIAARIPLVTDVEADIISAKNTLKRVMGLDLNTDISLTEEFSDTYSEKNYEELILELIEKEPTLRMLGENVLMREALVKAEKAEYMPNVYAFASWDYTGRSDQRKDWYVGDADLMDQFGVIGFQVDVPIFDSGRIREKIKQAQKEKEKAALELEKASRELTLELSNAVSEYNEYLKTLAANIRSVELSEKTFSLYQGLFSTGQVTLLELNDAELMLTNQRLEKETTLYNINVTLAKIERLIAEGVDK